MTIEQNVELDAAIETRNRITLALGFVMGTLHTIASVARRNSDPEYAELAERAMHDPFVTQAVESIYGSRK